MSELFLFVRPPRPLWPFNGPGSAFWPPLAFASLAAALREALPDLRVAILDAPALAMGWRSLEAEIKRLEPRYVGIGEEAVSCAEGLRLAAFAKRRGARVVAGGCFFGNVAPEVLATGHVDVVVHGEGEVTIVELVGALGENEPSALRNVRGISFQNGEETVFTGPRDPVHNLDTLPLPAYDLLPVERYGRGSRNHPDLCAIEASRGCSCGCTFCVLWRQMGRHRPSGTVPHLRTKSPERLLEEIRVLTRRFGRRYLGWVDPCFNADPEVPARLAELLCRDGLGMGQSAWVRADHIVRDATSGALAACVEAGLNEVYIGIERPDREGLAALNKQNRNGEVHEALGILRREHPTVFTVGSFIYGLPGDSPKTMQAIYRHTYELGLDLSFYIPLTPLPGTPYWRESLWDPTGHFFRSFDFLPHINGDPAMARLTWALYRSVLFSWPAARIKQFFRAMASRNPRRRSIVKRHAIRGLRYAVSGITSAVLGRRETGGMRIPRWYND